MRNIPRSDLSSYLRYVLQKRNLSSLFYMILGIAVIFILYLIFLSLLQNLRMIFFIILFFALGVISDSLNRFMPFSVGFELIMMGTVLLSVAYSPIMGMMVGILSLSISELFIMKFKIGLIFSFFGLAVVAFLAHIFKGTDITTLGITLTIIYDCIILPGYYFTGSNPLKLAIFSVTHIAFNVWVFTTLAPFFMRFLA